MRPSHRCRWSQAYRISLLANIRVRRGSGELRYTTPGAYSEDRSGSWNTIFKIDAC